MRLKRLKLHNFRIHRDLDLPFTDGVTCVFGQNGDGKSSVVEAIEFLLNGKLKDAKSEVLRNGSVTGYASGTFDCGDGKDVEITRWLDSPKLEATYDGKVYKKASEVTALWDKLFMITPDVVSNVLIAAQGSITMLFDGDAATRSKVFQRIFVVPATDKLRTALWEKGIKAAPPAKPVLDTEAITGQLADAKAQHDSLSYQLVLEQKAHEDLHGQLGRLTALQKSAAAFIKASSDLPTVQAMLDAAVLELERLEAEPPVWTYATDLVDITAATKVYQVYQDQLEHKASLQRSADNQAARYQEFIKDLPEPAPEVPQAYLDEDTELTSKVAVLDADIKRRSAVIGASTCPTCGGPVDACAEHVEDMRATRRVLFDSLVQVRKRNADLQAAYTAWYKLSSQALALEKLALQAKTAFEAAPTPKPPHPLCLLPAEEFNVLRTAAASFGAISDRYDRAVGAARIRVQQQRTKLEALRKQLPESKWTTVEAAQAVIDEYQTVNTSLITVAGSVQRLQGDIVSVGKWITHFEEQLQQGAANEAYNRKRAAYLSTLQHAYDAFHTSNFAKNLIMQYTGAVCERLTARLAAFKFPYRAVITDDFRIELYDRDDQKLPRISGGQQVMVGLALRLALHDMFGGALPLLIIDEGSAHLDAKARVSYFDMIDNLKRSSTGKQIIVIDHHPEVVDAVDNVINLPTAHER